MKLKMLFGLLVCASALYAADPRIEQGAIFVSKGEYEKALGEYRAILAENPKSSEAYFAAAEVRVKMQDYTGALANYRLAYKFTPTMSEAYEGAAKVYEILGSKAKADAERAKDPKNQPAEPVAEEQTVAAPPAPAIEEARPVPPPPAPVVEEPKAAPAPVAEKKQEPIKEVAKPAEQPKVEAKPEPVKEEPKDKFTYDGPMFQKGKKLFQEKKYSEAGAVWRDILKQQPGNPGAYYYAGAGRYELGELDKAEFNLKRAFDYPELGYNAHYYLSLIYKKQNKKKLEIQELNEYIKGTPSLEGKKNAQARIDELEGKTVQAKETASSSSAKSSSSVASSSSVKSSSSSEVVKAEPKPAEQSKAEAKAEAPKQVVPAGPATIESANILFAQGNMQAALTAYKEVLESGLTDDDHAFVLLQMGNIYRERRDYRMAVARYREVVESYPDSDWASEAERAWKDAVWQENHANQLPRKK